MPVIARFFGIIVKMFFDDHNPPHIHVQYGEYMGEIDINTQKLIIGDLPSRALSLSQEWVKLHKNALIEMWNSKRIDKLPPLE
jgi:hypothetical protein